MATEGESPAPESAATFRGRGRGGRGGRGRGRGASRAITSQAVSKTSVPASRGGRGGARRGRAKHFSEPRVQAAYERQRELKRHYQALAQACKPALQELASRDIQDLLQDPDRHREVTEFDQVVDELELRFARRASVIDHRRDWDVECAEKRFDGDQDIINDSFESQIDDLLEQFYEGQLNRLRILNSLYDKDLPVDIRDDQYEFKVISDDHYDQDFGIYEAFQDGHLVPYPSRVPGTDMYQRRADADSMIAGGTISSITESSTPTGRGRGRGRGGIKRKPQDQPEGPPTPKRPRAANITSFANMVVPAPARGLLASEVDTAPDGTPRDVGSVAGTPEPENIVDIIQNQDNLPSRLRSPVLSKKLTEPDEHNVRFYLKTKDLTDKASRIMLPVRDYFNDTDIGFRDSANLSTKDNNATKRGKYLGTPHSNGMYHDMTVCGYNSYSTQPEEFDQELVKRHGLHPKHGVFLSLNSDHEQEDPSPCVMPGKPIVYIANPSGRIHHASRSFQPTVNHHRAVDAPWRHKVGAAIRRFCKMEELDVEDISVAGSMPTDRQLRQRSLKTAKKELASRPSEEDSTMAEGDSNHLGDQQAHSDLSVLLEAAASIDVQKPIAPAPLPAKKYDVIRDMFVDARPEPPTPAAVAQEDQTALRALVEAALTNNAIPPKARRVVDDRPELPPNVANGTPHYIKALPHAPTPERQLPASGERQAVYPSTRPPENRVNAYEARRSSIHLAAHQPPGPPQPAFQSGYYTVDHHEPTGYPSTHERQPYRQHQEQPIAPQQPQYAPEFQPIHSYPPPPAPEHSGYPTSHTNYPGPQDPREVNRGSGRPFDHGYDHRRMSAYGAEHPAYSRPYWSEQPPPGPSGPLVPPQQGVSAMPPSGPHPNAPPPAASMGSHPGPGPMQHFHQGQSSFRIPFSQHASAEPLPPLRPSRTRSIQEEPAHHETPLRPQPQSGFGPYYMYGRGFPPPPEGQSQYQSSQMHNDRMMSGPPHQQHPPAHHSYQGPPPQGYPTSYSPTFAHHHMGGPAQMAHSPSEGPQNGPYRHRRADSGSAPGSGPGANANDPNANKYRKLQPAPIPAHRAWANKPELKTIPYEHKYGGQAAELPNSGPTQIRGWNVNSHKKRARVEKTVELAAHDREDSR